MSNDNNRKMIKWDRPVRSVRVGSNYQRRETLGDLSGEGERYRRNISQAIRDGAVDQRCGGGVRVIRKSTPE